MAEPAKCRDLSARFFPSASARSGRWDSNPRHLAWEASALPTELRPRGLDLSHLLCFSHVADTTLHVGRRVELAARKFWPPIASSLQMSKKYEIHSGRRIVSTQYSVSPLQAVVDYVRSYGVKDDEIRRLGVDSVSWRGARFSAVLVPAEPILPATSP